jgi:hypothetical protein
MKNKRGFLASCAVTLCSVLTTTAFAASSATLVNALALPGNLADLSGEAAGANGNQFGFFSDLFYDRYSNTYYALSDRGPGGGVISYNTRVSQFTLDVSPLTGEISNFKITNTVLFKTPQGQTFNGLNPQLLNGNSQTLGLSFDPEGFVVSRTGTFFVADEYGPSVYEFSKTGTFIRALNTPSNLQPRDAANALKYTGTPSTGRQENRGFEGLAITPDGTKLFAIMQDPLQQEGSGGNDPGRRSRNLRIVEFDVATGEAGRQFIYQLQPLAEINADLSPGETFGASAQGRNIGASAIVALNDHEFLVLERDNRGLGVDDPTASREVGIKSAFRIDISGATDVSAISLAGSNDLPPGVVPVSKNVADPLDVRNLLGGKSAVMPEKMEGLAIGPQLADGRYVVLVGTDNDYSVTQDSTTTQQEYVYIDSLLRPIGSAQGPLDGTPPDGFFLIPGFLYAFVVDADDPLIRGFVPQMAPVPLPAAAWLFGGGVLAFAAFVRRRGQ